MNKQQKRNLVIILTLLELGKRSMVAASGNAIATQAGTVTVERDGELLSSQALRTQLAMRGKA